jgi:hypothetical protein
MMPEHRKNSWSELLTPVCSPNPCQRAESPKCNSYFLAKSEQFCAELPGLACHPELVAVMNRDLCRRLRFGGRSHSALPIVQAIRETRSPAMDRVRHPFLLLVRTLRAFMAASLRRLFRMEPRAGDFASQRMCPFCGLITPRYEAYCLECGKSLKPA